ncbi:MAG: DNA adenine methylase [Planctomycetes bacterium]|nr:DNA adenine methylase [Planctomycetota bacterium]
MARRVPSSITGLTRPKVLAFGWYGGKFSHLAWLLPLLPKVLRYCEPFGGSGAVLLNRKPSSVETYNDLDGEVCNFFRVLRDEGEDLIRLIRLTPFSREEFVQACALDPSIPSVERARRFYVRARQVRTGLAQVATPGRWANCKDTSRSGMSGVVSRWLGGIDDLYAIAERLIRVQIENRPAVEVVELYDSEETLFYCDPPYVHETRGDASAYAYEMNDDEHVELARALNDAKGKVAVSGYDCDLMTELYPSKKWRKIVGPSRKIHSVKQDRREVLWVNYEGGDGLCVQQWID